MDKRKDTLSTLKICRFCLTQDVPLASIYDKKRKLKNGVNLPLKILSCVSVEVFPSDKMPSYICEKCRYFMNICYDFKQICRQADESILHYIQDSSPLKAVTWPVSLNEAYCDSNDIGVVKTVVEDGTTVQITHDMSDSEDEEEENVYNVKVNDGSDEVSKTFVKVVASRDNGENKEAKQKVKGFSTATTLSRHIRAHAGDKPYPCKYCDKTFTKSHHATRHQRLKHPDELQRDSVGHVEQLRCEQCEESFSNQDELIYHSAIHATQNLTCPLCQEKFHNVDAVTTHIKSHVNGVEFMCEFCELVFTSKEKLDGHMERAHEDELQHELSTEHQDDSSNEMEDTGMECDEEEDSIHVSVKEEDDHMVVEIKKAGDFMLKKPAVSVPTEEHKTEGSSHSEGESGSETEYAAATPAAIEQLATVKKISPKPAPKELVKPPASVPVQVKPVVQAKPSDQAVLIRKTEEIKRASPQTPGSPAEKKEKPVMAQVTKIENSNDKSLRLLEKELQDLKRTNSRSEAVKTPVNTPRPKGRPPLHSSTPKTKKGIYRPVEEKKTQVVNKPPVVEKKPVEKKITKENKEPKEIKEVKANNKEEKDNAQKNNKSIIKNGTSEKTGVEDGVRRSTRPSKIKDYAKMIRVNSQDDSESDELADDDEEYKEGDKTAEMGRVKARRSSVRPAKSSPAPSPAAAPAPAAPPRKRGRPRKEPPPGQETPAKTKKIESELAQEKPAEVEEKPEEAEERKKDSEEPRTIDEEPRERISQKAHQAKKDVKVDETQETSMSKAEPEPEKASETKERPLPVPYQITYDPGPSTSDAKIITPIVPSLKKVPIRSLPPGVKPLPLPLGRSSGELCEMQIGKKVVKVQKIVMTKAEVEAMAKQGLVEMKDGTMVLKQGIKLPKVESVKAVAAETEKESPTKKDKAAPTRCDFDDE